MIRISYVWFIAFVTATSGLLFGFDTGVIADTQWQLSHAYAFTSLDWSMIVSAMILGAFLGAIFSGSLSNWLGRKNTLLGTAYLFILASLLLAAAQGFYSLWLARFLLGVSIGVASYSAPLFIAEMAPSHLRGRFVLFNSVAITGGETISFLAGYLLENAFEGSWRLMFLIGLLPALCLWIGLLFVPQSPRWLIKNNRKEKAYAILKKMRRGDVEEEWQGLLEVATNTNEDGYRTLLQKPFRKLLYLGIGLGVLQQTSGINIIMYYGPYIFNHIGFSKQHALLSTCMMGAVNLLFTVLALCLIDKIGRRRLMIQGTGISGMALLILSISFFFKMSPYLAFTSILIYCMGFAVSLGCCFWLLISELYPLHLRVQAMSIATGCQWLANFLVSLIFLPLFETIGPGITMLIFSICCFIAFVFSYCFVPETKQISLEKIETNLMKGNRLRELGGPILQSQPSIKDCVINA